MMSKTMKAFLLLALVAVAQAARPMDVRVVPSGKAVEVHHAPQTVEEIKASYPFCGLCVQFAVTALNYLANAILNAGVIAGCNDLCGLLPNKYEADACEGLCYAAGIASFIEAIEHADLDFIYFCELIDKTGVDICPIADCPASNPHCVKLTNLVLAPLVGPQDTQFQFNLDINAENVTGTGMTRITWTKVGSGETGSADGLTLGFPVGQQQVQVTLDSSQGGPEDESGNDGPMEEGNYEATLTLCEGSCPANGENPHENNFGTLNATFTILGGVPAQPPAPWDMKPPPGNSPGESPPAMF